MTYDGNVYPVTSIGDYAFEECRNLTSVIIPNSVASIGYNAFYGCSSLTELTIPNSVASIGECAFKGCSSLTELTIPNSVASIAYDIFSGCSSLTSVVIPNSVISIGDYAFYECSSLTELTIPNSVTSIGECAFARCSSLTEVTIGNNVTSIGHDAFTACESLISVTIPNSVTAIVDWVFCYCTNLTEVIIGSSVTSIDGGAFIGCSNLTTVYSLSITPPSINTWAFDSNHYTTVDVFVPEEALEAYRTANIWKKFKNIQSINETGNELEKCATPIIHYANNTLTFNCETEDVTFESTITDSDISSYSSKEIQLGVTYNISVYAIKIGYQNSDVATATLCWIDVDPKTEGIDTDVVQVRANAVLIQSANGQIDVTGLSDGTKVTVYSIDGVQVGSAISRGGQVCINANMTPGSVAIVKIGDRSIKVVVK